MVALELTRDDGGALDDQGLAQLGGHLINAGLSPVLSRPDAGTVLVNVTVQARSDAEARSAAEHALRDGANAVWAEQGLPPFTIAALSAVRPGDD
jgi:hypothetical protein